MDSFVAGYAGGDVGVVDVERNVEPDAEVFDETLISVGFFPTEVVIDVDCGEAYSEGVALGGVGGVEGEEESCGVGSAGEGDAEAIAGVDLVAGEGKAWSNCHEPHVTVRDFLVSGTES